MVVEEGLRTRDRREEQSFHYFLTLGQEKTHGNSYHPFLGRAQRKQRDSFFSEEVDLVNFKVFVEELLILNSFKRYLRPSLRPFLFLSVFDRWVKFQKDLKRGRTAGGQVRQLTGMIPYITHSLNHT